MASLPFKSRLEQADQTLAEIYDGQHLTGFRDDVENIWVKNRDNHSWDVDSETIAREVRTSVKQSRQKWLTIEDGINKLQIIDGITGGAVAFLTYTALTSLGLTQLPSVTVSILIFLLFTMLNHGILYTKAIVNRVCYLHASPRESDSRLLFKRGWNAKVLSSNSSIMGILVVALTRRIWRGAYEIGLEKLEELDKKRYC